MSVKPIPEGYHSITPYLGIKAAAKAIEFYKEAFGANEIMRLDMPNGDVGHAELRIGDSAIMLATPCSESGLGGPDALQGTSVGLHLYVNDVDSQFARALKAGATAISEVKDQFYGDRSGTVTDPFGHSWTLATHVEDIPNSELQSRMEEWMKKEYPQA